MEVKLSNEIVPLDWIIKDHDSEVTLLSSTYVDLNDNLNWGRIVQYQTQLLTMANQSFNVVAKGLIKISFRFGNRALVMAKQILIATNLPAHFIIGNDILPELNMLMEGVPADFESSPYTCSMMIDGIITEDRIQLEYGFLSCKPLFDKANFAILENTQLQNQTQFYSDDDSSCDCNSMVNPMTKMYLDMP